jgi:hypothetical protein
MRVLVDTNILLRSAQPNLPLCPQATQAVSKLLREKIVVFFCSQNIAEFWNVATRPAEVSGLEFSHSEVLQEISSIESLLTLLPDIPTIYPVLETASPGRRRPGCQGPRCPLGCHHERLRRSIESSRSILRTPGLRQYQCPPAGRPQCSLRRNR